MADSVAVAVRFDWRARGAIHLDNTSKFRFPVIERVPGLYRFTLAGLGPPWVHTSIFRAKSTGSRAMRIRAGNRSAPLLSC